MDCVHFRQRVRVVRCHCSSWGRSSFRIDAEAQDQRSHSQRQGEAGEARDVQWATWKVRHRYRVAVGFEPSGVQGWKPCCRLWVGEEKVGTNSTQTLVRRR